MKLGPEGGRGEGDIMVLAGKGPHAPVAARRAAEFVSAVDDDSSLMLFNVQSPATDPDEDSSPTERDAVLIEELAERAGIQYMSYGTEIRVAEDTEWAIIVVLWITFLIVGTFVLLLTLPSAEYSLANVVFEVASAHGNVGLSSGITGPESLPTVGKVAFLFHMWIGRLEIIPVLVTLRTIFQRGGLYR